MKVSKLTLTLSLLLLPLLAKTLKFSITRTPVIEVEQIIFDTTKEHIINNLYRLGDDICKEHGINTRLMIIQAVAESGWNLNNKFNFFNILAFKHKSEVVNDNGNLRNYRIYESPRDAIEDYCELLSKPNSKYYNGITNITITEQIDLIGKSKYAESDNYHTLLTSIYKSNKKLFDVYKIK